MTPRTARAYEKINGLPALNWPVTAAHLGAPARRGERGWPVGTRHAILASQVRHTGPKPFTTRPWPLGE
jgi:hypothetical protein